MEPRSTCAVVPALAAGIREHRLTVVDPDGSGVAALVRTLVLLPRLQLVVAVDPATEKDPRALRASLTLATSLGVRRRIQLVRTSTPEALQTALAAAGILVTVPQGAAERELIAAAMWSGVPVVASDVPAARDLIETGCSGLVLSSGDTRRLARAVSVVCRDGSGRVQWARAARRRAFERFDAGATARALAAALERAAVGVGHLDTSRVGRRASAGGSGGTAAS